MRHPSLFLATLSVMSLTAGIAFSQEDAARIVVLERETNLEAGKDATLHLSAPAAPRGKIAWTVSLGRAPIARGEGALDADKKIAVKIPSQSVKPGVILEATLVATAVKDDGAFTKLVQSFWILPPDPFADRLEWAKALKVVLYDTKGTTAEVLKKADFPFEDQKNLAAIGEIKAGVVLVGEGISWREDPGLSDTVNRLAERGVKVLCLAPSDGTLRIPGLGKTASKNVSGIQLGKRNVITAWDKRLDADRWHGKPSVVASLSVLGEGEDVVCTASTDGEGWPWLEAQFGEAGGVLAISGFGVIRHWDSGPTPRYVFLRMLEKITNDRIK